ncbi:hypothetical protein [Arthrobacter globiformis]|uniref:hypothetical protein n=1 Tax=Arthrobacter globiformis TaxID=1665 RepID=UPI0027874D92|nr:hypothetical protein [Arthrobacter globiformis]MDQ0863996.1 hypothetical protein [Arthrobacter globiformis]
MISGTTFCNVLCLNHPTGGRIAGIARAPDGILSLLSNSGRAPGGAGKKFPGVARLLIGPGIDYYSVAA